MEDFIYILLGIVWVVFSIIKGTQKKKQAQYEDLDDTTPERGGGLEEWLEEFLPPSPKPAKVEETYYPSFDDDATAYDHEENATAFEAFEHEGAPDAASYKFYDGTLEDIAPEIVSLEEMDDLSHMLYKTDEDQSKESSSRNTSSWHENFSLRNAIIYQAILERPYQ